MKKLFILTGPSGVGKSSIAKKLLKEAQNIKRLVTYTTRPARETEKDKIDYNFVSKKEFQRMIDNDELFEWAKVYNEFYGSNEKDLNNLLESENVIMIVDVQGAETIKEKRPDANIIFIKAEYENELLKRLERRDHGNTFNLKERQEALQQEMEFAKECQFIVTNKDEKMDEAVQEIKNIIES